LPGADAITETVCGLHLAQHELHLAEQFRDASMTRPECRRRGLNEGHRAASVVDAPRGGF
jgi:hypothetical protein